MRFLAFIGLLMTLLVTSCTTNVVVEGTIPTPLVKTLPVTVGVYYDENFKTFRHTEALEAEGTWNVDIGQQNLTFFRNLMGSMFENVVELDSPEVSKAQMAELDGVVIPRIEKYGFLTPGISGLKFFSASIHYRLTLIDKNNKVIKDWTVLGYGKSEGGAFTSGDALGEATMLAIRDGGARISIGLTEQPEVVRWIEELDKAGDEN